MEEEGAKYAIIDQHVFRIDSANRFEATKILLKAQFIDEFESIRSN